MIFISCRPSFGFPGCHDRLGGGIQPSAYLNPFQNLQGPALDVFKMTWVETIIFFDRQYVFAVEMAFKSLRYFCPADDPFSLSTGLLVSISRYLLVSFSDLYFCWAKSSKRGKWFDVTTAAFFALQVIYFAGWVNYYWNRLKPTAFF